MQKYVNLYNFWITVLHNKSVNNVKLLQMKFLEDLKNGFKIYKKFKKFGKKLDYNASDLYLLLCANQKGTVDNLFLNTPTNKHDKETY